MNLQTMSAICMFLIEPITYFISFHFRKLQRFFDSKWTKKEMRRRKRSLTFQKESCNWSEINIILRWRSSLIEVKSLLKTLQLVLNYSWIVVYGNDIKRHIKEYLIENPAKRKNVNYRHFYFTWPLGRTV